MTVSRTTAFALALLLGMSAQASAQAAPSCGIDDGKPGQVKDARNAIVKAELIGKPEDKMKEFIAAVSKLSNPKDTAKINKENPIGARLVLGRALANIVTVPNQPLVVKRSSIGFQTNPDGMIDIIAEADAALDAVEAADPACKADMKDTRQRLYAVLVNPAVNLYNERQVDSAEVLTKRAIDVYDGFPLTYIAYNILGNIQQTKGDMKGAAASFRKMGPLMKEDTSLVDERKNTMLVAARIMINEAEGLEGDAKAAALREIVNYIEGELLVEYPNDPTFSAALVRPLMQSGQKEKADALIKSMLANRENFTDIQLFEVGVEVARADLPQVAIELFEAGLKKNPYSRDGLFNVGATLSQAEMWDKMPPYLERLIQVDPENPDNYRLWALLYQGRAKTLKPLAEKKPETDPNVKAYNAANDSLLKYFKRYSEPTVKVQFSLFSHDGPKHTLAGTVENLSDAAKPFTLKFDFLDATGATVVSKEYVVEEVPAKSSKSFRVEVEGQGIVAFKYAPLTM